MMVHWVVDRALGRSEGGYEALVQQLDKQGVSYSLVRKPPFADYLVGVPESDEPAEIDRANNTPVELDIPNPVFVTGTMSMKLVSAKHGWTPGYVDAPGQTELFEHWGEHVLNHDAVVSTMRDAVAPSARFFARPVEDTKSFPGTVFSHEDFSDWHTSFLNGDTTSYVTMSPDDLIMLAPLKTIYAEYRLYVIGGEIVTGSRYKLGNKVMYTRDLDPKMLEYAKERIAEYCPRRALCLDIAHTDLGYRVIETNAISSSGFYACDMGQFVNAINEEFGG